LPVALTGTWAQTTKAKNPDAAKAFLQFMAENESIYASAVSTPTVDPSQAPTTTSPALETVQKFVDAKKTAPYPDQTWPNAEVQAAQIQGVQDLFSGAATVPQVLQTMQDAFDKGVG
jgi:raffinose/stachyose/melibiose transport system substrate-binding protein